jgi:hypothetical protein
VLKWRHKGATPLPRAFRRFILMTCQLQQIKYLAVQAERFRNPQFRIFCTGFGSIRRKKTVARITMAAKYLKKIVAGLFKKQ